MIKQELTFIAWIANFKICYLMVLMVHFSNCFMHKHNCLAPGNLFCSRDQQTNNEKHIMGILHCVFILISGAAQYIVLYRDVGN